MPTQNEPNLLRAATLAAILPPAAVVLPPALSTLGCLSTSARPAAPASRAQMRSQLLLVLLLLSPLPASQASRPSASSASLAHRFRSRAFCHDGRPPKPRFGRFFRRRGAEAEAEAAAEPWPRLAGRAAVGAAALEAVPAGPQGREKVTPAAAGKAAPGTSGQNRGGD